MSNSLKQKVFEQIEKYQDEIIKIGEQILKNPELGFKETNTAQIIKDVFQKLNIPFESDLAITGVRGDLMGGESGPTVAVIGELDAITCSDFPDANPQTKAAHVCGHHAQIAALAGVCFGLVTSGIMAKLKGQVALMAVPAEELVEIEYRQNLKQQGLIKFMGGKQELIRLGVFDDIDMAMMTHALPQDSLLIGGTSNGFIGKKITYLGEEAHAGGAPHEGINALNAANIGLMAINALRETFKDEDHIRVHYIITKGGDIVNVVPCEVKIEMFVRGASIAAIKDASQKVNRALKAGAMAIGAEVEIIEIPGYLPLLQDQQFADLYVNNAKELYQGEIIEGGNFAASTDMGDVSQIMPAIHPMLGGFAGSAHHKSFRVKDPVAAYVLPAKLMAATVIDLLDNEAKLAKKIISSFKPALKKADYLAVWDQMVGEKS